MNKVGTMSSFPPEMILKIISHLSDIDDLRNCMLLSKELRELMLRTPEIIRKILINVDVAECDSAETIEILEFLEVNGNFVRCLRLTLYATSACLKLRSILSEMRNLEEITLKLYRWATDKDACYEVDENFVADFPKLRVMETDLESFLLLMPNEENFKSLVNLTVHYGDNEKVTSKHCEHFINFLCQQKNLKKFDLKLDDSCRVDFPHRDISSEVEFKLRTLSLSRIKVTPQPLLDEFLKVQGRFLDELLLENCPNDDFLDFMFENFQNLKKLRLYMLKSNSIFSNKFPHWEINSLIYFEELSNCFLSDKVNLVRLVERFPNLEHLKCGDLLSTDQVFDKITTLELNYSDFSNLNHIKLPNLKALAIKTTTLILQNNWESFARNIPKVEDIFIDFQYGGRFEADAFNFLKNIENLENLKSFGIDFMRFKATEYEWRKCRIDFQKKIVKFSADVEPVFEKLLKSNFGSYQLENISVKICLLTNFK